MPHVRQSHAEKIYGLRLKNFEIITKVAPKVYSVKSAVKANILMGALRALSAPIAVFGSKLPKRLGMYHVSEGLFLICRFRAEH